MTARNPAAVNPSLTLFLLFMARHRQASLRSPPTVQQSEGDDARSGFGDYQRR